MGKLEDDNNTARRERTVFINHLNEIFLKLSCGLHARMINREWKMHKAGERSKKYKVGNVVTEVSLSAGMAHHVQIDDVNGYAGMRLYILIKKRDDKGRIRMRAYIKLHKIFKHDGMGQLRLMRDLNYYFVIFDIDLMEVRLIPMDVVMQWDWDYGSDNFYIAKTGSRREKLTGLMTFKLEETPSTFFDGQSIIQQIIDICHANIPS